MQGKIIVFEGIDGSGKGTQSKKLYSYLKSKNHKVVLFEFPSYNGTFFGKEVGNYLNGKFGKLDEVNPKLSAMLYAGDRYEKRDEIIKKINENYIVICDRYVPSNIAHQISKYTDIGERSGLKKWIEELEYQVYKLPKPHIIFFMDMNPNFSTDLVSKKGAREYTNKKKDLHESDNNYLNNVYQTFKILTKEENWIDIKCQTQNGLKNIEEIHLEILDKVGI
ncbi:MAG: dTMP kinase [Campylobacteraceae bacterium]|nr:dTMP kinase [Campylobacteraceae bacterium]